MAWTGLLAEIHPPVDADYVDQFQRLAELNLDMKRLGPSKELLVRRSILEAALGNYHASRVAAKDAVLLDRADAEPWFQLGMSCMYLAYAEAGAVAASLADMAWEAIPLADLLEEARDAFERSADANPEDEEAGRLAAEVAAIRVRHPEEPALRALMLGESRGEPTRPPRPKLRRG